MQANRVGRRVERHEVEQHVDVHSIERGHLDDDVFAILVNRPFEQRILQLDDLLGQRLEQQLGRVVHDVVLRVFRGEDRESRVDVVEVVDGDLLADEQLISQVRNGRQPSAVRNRHGVQFGLGAVHIGLGQGEFVVAVEHGAGVEGRHHRLVVVLLPFFLGTRCRAHQQREEQIHPLRHSSCGTKALHRIVSPLTLRAVPDSEPTPKQHTILCFSVVESFHR